MFGRSFELFKIFGFQVKVDVSWFIVAVLFTWSLAVQLFPTFYQGLGTVTYWVMGAAGALGLFLSVVVHELSHSLVARRHGTEMRGITLFIFGGVAEMSQEPDTPKAEFLVAVAGPITSLGVAAFFLAVYLAADVLGAPVPVTGVLAYLAGINVLLALFNMIPAFPLDGGRVLRSALWHWKNDVRWATRVAAGAGSGFGLALILFGVLRFISGSPGDGLWMLLIGLFVRHAAQMSYRQLLLRRVLEGEPVSRFMETNPVTVPRAISVADLVDSYVYRHHFKMFPVVDGDRLLGCVTTRRVRELPREEWDRQSVGAIIEAMNSDNTVEPTADAMAALATMSRTGLSRLMVVDGDRLVGILALKDLLKFFSLKMELQDT